jgi:hypothetical protein
MVRPAIGVTTNIITVRALAARRPAVRRRLSSPAEKDRAERLFGEAAGAIVAYVAVVTERRDAVQRAPEDLAGLVGIGQDHGGDYTYSAVFVVEDLDGLFAYLTHPTTWG